jgi:hypothetical protein
MKSFVLALGVALAVVANAIPALAQSSAIVREQLDSAAVMMRNEGYVLQGSPLFGALEEGQQYSITFPLGGGAEYVILGVCDGDCSDLDLLLVDASSQVIDTDFEPDDVPIVGASVDRTGSYTLTVSMAECSIEPCGYGIGIFAAKK